MRAHTSGLALLVVLCLAIIAMLAGLAAQDEDELKDSRSPSAMSEEPWHKHGRRAHKDGRHAQNSQMEGLNLAQAKPLGSP